MSKFSLMKPIDKLLIESIDKLSLTAEYQKMLDSYNSWEDAVQNIFKAGLIFLSFALPLFIVFIFYMLNSTAKNNLQITEEIISAGNDIILTSAKVKSISKRYFGKSISSKPNFERELANTLPAQGIDSAKILIGNFTLEDIDGVNELKAELKFSNLSSENLYGLFNILAVKLKMKIEEVSIKKNLTTNLLDGTLNTIHFSPIPEEL